MLALLWAGVLFGRLLLLLLVWTAGGSALAQILLIVRPPDRPLTTTGHDRSQGCQRIHFQTKFGSNLEGLAMEDVGILYLVYFTAIWYILQPFGIFYSQLVYFTAIWYIFWLFGIFSGYVVYFLVIWYIFCIFGIFSVYLVYFLYIWYIFWLFGIFLPVLVCCSKKNQATLIIVLDR
jgi:hypothetical protein